MSQIETKEFQTEIRQLLDIVINSLYTDREIFLRELVSNAADASEKLRYIQLTGQEIQDKDLPLEIRITPDENAFTLTIADSGMGMTKDDLIENLGTIAHSGSKAFVQRLAEAGDNKDVNLIGQFGVGFYSAFMVADKVALTTRSYQPEALGYRWESDGRGDYSISEEEDLPRGTHITLYLKEDAHDFAKADTVKRIIKQYSSFVPYPVFVNDEKINTVQALWTKNKNEVSEEEYTEFYKYVANAFDEPLLKMHFSSDAPININTLLFVPSSNMEKFGFGRMDTGINLYCKKVLIQEKAKDILPEWLRFVRGVIDSEELPLNISRETMQDSALVAKLNKVVTSRFLKFLDEQAKNEPEKFKTFWSEFSIFLKEGAANDFTHRQEIMKLLRYESSKTGEGELISLGDYVSRMKEGQELIYFINGPTREIIEKGPYLEVFKDKDYEVIYTYEGIDDYVFDMIREYEGKRLISADQEDLKLVDTDNAEGDKLISEEELNEFSVWLKEVLGAKVTEVRESKRLVDSPAIILSHYGTHSMQRMMQMMNRDLHDVPAGILEINPKHGLIQRLNELRKQEDSFAPLAAEQLFANAQIAAGIIVDPRSMVNRLNEILEKALN
ncbi:molecular chaperone of HSP90 family [Desulfitobacterium dichloroeliminans LMG P-21439]|uniref:Chaperone protein HtpG n=1 Tax=Desulfitobacterium dichloroeliminans (strain LMG P-21439 / DCA1) TaxID=871963 RepID=L0F9P3_DESDL|nr:molecular chaperone HtpG [Desulfitobacterium dichloroeliminans]AGA69663.1 molecular chaperone of HSP90 family [Desulfitobacterium dichloroeliminans LMG P-21439]